MKWQRAARAAVKYTIVTALSLLLFIWWRGLAFEQRGYEAIGGEYAAFLIPLIWYAVERNIRDALAARNFRKKGGKRNEDQDDRGLAEKA